MLPPQTSFERPIFLGQNRRLLYDVAHEIASSQFAIGQHVKADFFLLPKGLDDALIFYLLSFRAAPLSGRKLAPATTGQAANFQTGQPDIPMGMKIPPNFHWG
jgi:hypothetical protein